MTIFQVQANEDTGYIEFLKIDNDYTGNCEKTELSKKSILDIVEVALKWGMISFDDIVCTMIPESEEKKLKSKKKIKGEYLRTEYATPGGSVADLYSNLKFVFEDGVVVVDKFTIPKMLSDAWLM